MLSNRLAFVALAVACIASAAGGGYLATRQTAVPASAAAQSSAPEPVAQAGPAQSAAPAPTATRATTAVQETEAVVADSAPKPTTPPAAARSAARRLEPAPRAHAREATPSGTMARREPPPALQSTWPASAASQPPAAQAPLPAPVVPELPRPAEPERVQEAPRLPEPPRPTFEELVISAESVIGLQTEGRITSETARVEDRVEARVTRDVRVGNRVAIPAGSRAVGTVTQVDRGGKFKEQAKLGIRFNSIVLADGTRLPISTETIVRVGEAPGNNSASKIGGGAVGGAIIGALLGGAKGAAVGATAGAGAGAAAVQVGDKSAAVLQPGTPLTVRILSPVTVTIER
jgi:hypothetical protein